jgi:hypothetical protein
LSSTPVWVPLAVAAVGVAGTLGAAFFTRRWADRREDQRWKREREAEQTRWQREQNERREQWQREDAARWLTERRAVYAEFLLVLRAWELAIYKAQGEKQRTELPPQETVSALSRLEDQCHPVYETLSILAPEPIVNLSASSLMVLSSWTFHLCTYGGDAVNEFSGEMSNFSRESTEHDRSLRDAIRQDLGVDPPSA